MAIRIRKGSAADTESYLQLLHVVKEHMDHPEWFYLDPDEDVRAMMANGMMELWVAEDEDGTLAGGFDIIHPGLAECNYGWDLDFSESELMRVIQMDTAAVHPDYRGQKLQWKLMQEAEKSISQKHRGILLCTVHPDNRYSLQNVLKQDYTIVKKKEKYGSVRYILRKDLP